MTASAAADRVEPGFSELAAALDAVADAIGTLGPDDVSRSSLRCSSTPTG
ncbi:MAG: hypothetical protein R2749_25280 [Acidimicrobiales bacterium]